MPTVHGSRSGFGAPFRPLGQDRFHPHARQRARARAALCSAPRSTPDGAMIALGSSAGHAVDAACTRGTGSQRRSSAVHSAVMGRGRPPQISRLRRRRILHGAGQSRSSTSTSSRCAGARSRRCASSPPRPVTPTTTSCASTGTSRARSAIRRTSRCSGATAARARSASTCSSRTSIYVGGGSILSLLGVWRAHGIDEDLRAAWQAGVILVGVSAGSLCWFASGLTAYHHDAKPYEGLGFLPHSNAVHYEEESNRRPAYHAALLDGELPGGYAASDGAALHFVGEDLHRVVLSRPEARAYRVEAVGDERRGAPAGGDLSRRTAEDHTCSRLTSGPDDPRHGRGRLHDGAGQPRPRRLRARRSPSARRCRASACCRPPRATARRRSGSSTPRSARAAASRCTSRCSGSARGRSRCARRCSTRTSSTSAAARCSACSRSGARSAST